MVLTIKYSFFEDENINICLFLCVETCKSQITKIFFDASRHQEITNYVLYTWFVIYIFFCDLFLLLLYKNALTVHMDKTVHKFVVDALPKGCAKRPQEYA